MDAQRWQQARALFQDVLKLDPEGRDSYLDRACTDDVSLRPEIERLLVSLDEAGDFLESPAAGIPADPYEGLEIPPYRLVKRIGQGGMGVVYLAERADDTFQKNVAIKLLKPGEDSEDLVRRFQAERQILAGLDHPSIAKVFDGGTTANGLPYLVMEYIEGRPIDEYCDRHKLSTRQRLELFRHVCSAVHFAHQKLVVHRDLKPANVLVTDDGTPKLLDFGIAKLLNQELSGQRIQRTATAQHLMSLPYASPEQLRAGPVSTATDVYSLGALLYELLTGHAPYQVTNGSPAELVTAICDTEPLKPSEAVRRHTEIPGPASERVAPTPEIVSRTRDGEPLKLQRRLRGDVDNIVLLSLRKEPQRRYASVEQLAADIRRHLEGRPVLASGDSLAYRSRKFIRRHRLGVSVAAVFVATCLGFGVVMGAQRARIADERDRAEEERNRAERVTEFLVGLFAISDPYKQPGDPISAEEILEDGSRRIESELQEEPETQAKLMSTVGQIYLNLGQYEAAESHLRKALKIRREVIDNETLEVAHLLDGLASVLTAKSDYEAAEDLFRQALILRRRLLGNEHPDISLSLHLLASLFWSKHDPEAGHPLAEQALQMRREHFSSGHPLVADSLNVLAKILASQNKKSEAEDLFRESLRIRRKHFGDEHPLVGQSLGHLAPLLHDMGELEEAELLYREALRISRNQLGSDHPVVGTKLNNLASLLSGTGNFAEAKPLLYEALEILRRRLGDDNLHVAASLTNLAGILQQQGDYTEAERLLREALAICRKRPQREEIYVASVLQSLAKLTAAKGDFVEAEQQIRAALEIVQRTWSEDSWKLLRVKNTLADILVGLGRYREAEELLLRVHPGLESARGKDSLETLDVLKSLVALYDAWGRPEQAARFRAQLG